MSRYEELKEELRNTPKRWCITGIAGFIGSALCEELLQLGQEVVGLDNFCTGFQHNLDSVKGIVGDEAYARLRFVEGDITNPEDCEKACEGVDYVLHQAALGSVPRSIDDPIASHEANVNGFVNMLMAGRDAGAKRFVYASSSAVYGDHPGLPKVEQEIGRQLSPYAVTKRVNELYAGVFQDNYDFESIGLRYFNVFGRRQDPQGAYAAVIPRWLAFLIAGEPCSIYGDGSFSRDFCYIDNVVQANLLAATSPKESSNTVYNVGCNGNTDLNELYRILRDSVAETNPAVAGKPPVYEDGRAGDIPHSQASIDRIVDALGYDFTYGVEEGLQKTVAWYISNLAA